MDLDGAVAVVTGAAGGLGHFLASGLAASGARVLAADIDPSPSEINGMEAVRCDVTVPSDRERLIALATAAGGPHILVNNAGGWTPGAQYPAAAAGDWMRTLELNLTAPMHLTQLALEPMAAFGGGAILNIASSAGLGRDPYGSPE